VNDSFTHGPNSYVVGFYCTSVTTCKKWQCRFANALQSITYEPQTIYAGTMRLRSYHWSAAHVISPTSW